MLQEVEKVYESGKRSLESLLRERAYSEVKEVLAQKGIDINQVSDEDIQTLVAAKITDMQNTLRGVGVGVALSLAISMLTGI